MPEEDGKLDELMELEKELADENLEEIDIKPLTNRILLQVRNKLGI
jgi:hypothetical protein